MVGLGRMGANMVRRLQRAGHECVAYDLSEAAVQASEADGAHGARTPKEVVDALSAPRHVWLMVPAAYVGSTIDTFAPLLSPGDTLIDGGNSWYRDDVDRAGPLREQGINYLDVGTSGGVFGLDRGYCLMIGGPTEAVEQMAPIFDDLAPGAGDISRTPGYTGEPAGAEKGWLHCGPNGAGHFVKMVHNGIEYGLMQAYAEGLDIFRNANLESLPEDIRYDLNIADIAELWRRGSVVGSWLLDLTAMALAENPSLSNYSGFVQDSGEGRWTIQTAIEEAVPVDVLATSLFARFRSRQDQTFADKVLSAMRNKFGGHIERPTGG